MFTYFRIVNGGTTSDAIFDVIEKEEELIGYNKQETSVVNAKNFIVPVSVTNPSHDPDTQVKDGPVDVWDGTSATRTYTVRPKTQQELDADQRADDLIALKDAGKDLALVLTELVQWNLDNTAMVADDFTASVKQAYLDLKVIADRVK